MKSYPSPWRRCASSTTCVTILQNLKSMKLTVFYARYPFPAKVPHALLQHNPSSSQATWQGQATSWSDLAIPSHLQAVATVQAEPKAASNLLKPGKAKTSPNT